MASTTDAALSGQGRRGTTNTRGRGGGRDRGRGRSRGRGRGNANGSGDAGGDGLPGHRAKGADASASALLPDDSSTASGPVLESGRPVAPAGPTSGGGGDNDEGVDAEVCFICANPVLHQSVAPCNHRTCHLCALRMRALYKNKECAHCRTVANFVIFTDNATKRYEDYLDQDVTSIDNNIGIRYADEDIVGDTVLLLRYNCPDMSCDFAGLGWPDLHRHVRSTHNKKMCDLCTRNKKVFTHEHELFTDKELERHMRHGDDQPGAVDQTGFKGHPLCVFCGSRFHDDDKLYEHCRSRHERCFLCDRQDTRQPHYYRDYNSLEEHFKKDHYLCPDRECQEKKFVVFGSEMDLKAHQLSEHADSLSKDVRREARMVDLSGFDVRERYQNRRGEGPGRGRGRGRDPFAEPLPGSSAQPLRRDEVALQRQMAIHSSQSVSNRTFGGQLSSDTSASAGSSAPSRSRNAGVSNSGPPATAATATTATATTATAEMAGLSLSNPNLSPEDRARLMRHSAVIERASNLLHNDKAKIERFRSHISSFRQGRLAAPGLVDALFSLFADISSSALGTLVREVTDLFEDKAKSEGLRKAWNDWRAINEDYPTLPGLGGMRGATTSTSGWAAAAAASSPITHETDSNQRHTTRVLKLKNSTQQPRRPSAEHPAALFPGGQAGRNVTSSTSAFPSLSPSGSGPSKPASGAYWGATATRSSTPVRATPGANREDAFPALPAAPKPTTTIFGYGRGSVRRDVGTSRDTGFSWGGTANEGAPMSAGGEGEVEEESGKGKKGNKGRKKVIVQWG